jgi:hypothetical protein
MVLYLSLALLVLYIILVAQYSLDKAFLLMLSFLLLAYLLYTLMPTLSSLSLNLMQSFR